MRILELDGFIVKVAETGELEFRHPDCMGAGEKAINENAVFTSLSGPPRCGACGRPIAYEPD